MLDERLSRRSSVRDTYWLGRLEAEAVRGNPEASRQTAGKGAGRLGADGGRIGPRSCSDWRRR